MRKRFRKRRFVYRFQKQGVMSLRNKPQGARLQPTLSKVPKAKAQENAEKRREAQKHPPGWPKISPRAPTKESYQPTPKYLWLCPLNHCTPVLRRRDTRLFFAPYLPGSKNQRRQPRNIYFFQSNCAGLKVGGQGRL